MTDPRSLLPTPFVKRLTQAVSYELSGGWFTPEMPLVPQHPETAGRRYDYLAGFNISTTPRRDTGIDFQQLRNLAGYYDILRIIIEKRKDQISNYEWSIVPSDTDAGEEPSPEVAADIDRVTEFMKTPDRRLSWSRWIRQVIEDYLVLDAVALWPVYKGKQCQRIEIVDPATIKLVIDESGRRPEPPYPAYQQVLHGTITSNYLKDELRYFISNPASNRLYGLSKVEQILITTQIGLRRELQQLQFFTEGNIPEAIAGVPDGWTPQQITLLQQAWDGMLAGNTAERRKLKFIPGDAAKVMLLKGPEATLKTEFDEWLIRIICFTFGVSPTPFVKQVNRATAETAATEAREEGLGPSLSFIKDIVDTLIHSVLGVKGLEFRWSIEQDVDPGVQATIDDQYLRNGVMSVDEVRQRMGLEAIGVENMVYLGTGPVPMSMYKDGTAPNLQPKPAPPAPDEPGAEGGGGSGAPPGGGKPPSPRARDAAEDVAAEKLAKKEGLPSRVVPFRRLKHRY